MEEEGICRARSIQRMAKSLPARRLGTPENLCTCAFLCVRGRFYIGAESHLDECILPRTCLIVLNTLCVRSALMAEEPLERDDYYFQWFR